MFKRAILQSGSLISDKHEFLNTKPKAIKQAKIMARYLSCSDSDDQLVKCLRNASAEDLMEANGLTFETGTKMTFSVVGTQFVPISPQEAFKTNRFDNNIDIMIGV